MHICTMSQTDTIYQYAVENAFLLRWGRPRSLYVSIRQQAHTCNHKQASEFPLMTCKMYFILYHN